MTTLKEALTDLHTKITFMEGWLEGNDEKDPQEMQTKLDAYKSCFDLFSDVQQTDPTNPVMITWQGPYWGGLG